MPDIQSAFDQVMYELVMEHLGKLATYVPGPIKNAGGEKSKLLERYRADPLFSVFGLDTPEYLGATLAGGSVTSLHRKLGDIYEACVRAMAVGAQARSGATFAVATTGVAGPTGGSVENPVGTVWLAVATAAGSGTRKVFIQGIRERIQARAATSALQLAWDALHGQVTLD